MNGFARLLLVEDSTDDARLIARALARGGIKAEIERVDDAASLGAALARGGWDAVLCDYNLPGFGGPAALAIVRPASPDLPFIVVSGTIGEEAAAEMMRTGASDYVMKTNLTRLAPALARELEQAAGRAAKRRAEREVAEAAERYRDLVENSLDLICTHDLEGRLLSVNEAAARLTGYPREALVGRNFADLLDPPVRPQFAGYLAEIRASGTASGTLRLRTASGEARWLEYRNSLRTEGVAAPIVRGTAHDVTERRRAEEKLAESEARFRALTAMSSDFYWESDAEHRLTVRGEESKPSTVAEFQAGAQIGKRRWEVPYLSPDAAGWAAHRADLDARRPFRDFVVSRSAADGAERFISLSGDPVLDAAGRFAGYRGVGTDITARRRGEARVDRLSRMYRMLYRASRVTAAIAERDALLEAICNVACEEGGFAVVWAGIAEGGWLRGVAAAGGAQERHPRFARVATSAEVPEGRGPSGRAFREGRTVVCNDALAEADLAPWKEDMARHGTRALAAFPLRVRGEYIGTLSTNGPRAGMFDAELVGLLEELASMTAQALERIALAAERDAAQQAQAAADERLRLAVEGGEVGLWELDLQTGAAVWNERHRAIAGIGPGEEISFERFAALVHPEDRPRVWAGVDSIAAGAERTDLDFRMVRPDGEVRWVSSKARVDRGADGRALRLRGAAIDITEHKRQEGRIAHLARVQAMLAAVGSAIVHQRSRERLFAEACRIAVEHGGYRMAWIGAVDATGGVQPLAWSGEERGYLAERQRSHEANGAPANSISRLALRTRRAALENDLAADSAFGPLLEAALERGYRAALALPLSVQGEPAAIFVLYAERAGAFTDEELQLLEGMGADLSFALEHMARGERLDHLARHDPTTGLPNRRAFAETLERELRAQPEAPFAVALLDLVRFRAINETLGRVRGDEVLKEVAARLRRRDGSSAHLGGDVFAVLLRGERSGPKLRHELESITARAMGQAFRVAERELRIDGRVGVALYPADGADAEALLRNAETALRRARAGRAQCMFYAPELNAQVADALLLENRLRRAVERREFVLHYQPKFRLADGALAGVEALLRWQDPEAGLVPPGAFVPLLEETGLIAEVGAWAMRQALADRRGWAAAGALRWRVAVNVSTLQLARPDFVDEVRAALGDGPGEALELEITESMAMETVERDAATLERIRALGVAIAIDDFGTGYSSLAYVARLPVSVLKIDRSFVARLGDGQEGLAIVSSIIALARSLQIVVVAEGVETEAQAAALRALGCDQAQGYLFGRPVPAADIARLCSRPESSGR